MKQPLFTGVCTALITPFEGEGLNLDAFDRLLDRQLAAKVGAVVISGTTGECATLTDEEKLTLLQHAIRHVQGRCKIIMGTGSNCTKSAAHLSRMAEAYGADGILVVTPYYNKTTQDGLISHYLAIADSVALPLIVYNVPSRTGMSITTESYRRLAAHPNINGVKEASGNTGEIARLLHECGDSLFVWSGSDEQTVPLMAIGAKGVISTVSNLIPEAMVRMTNACLAGDFTLAGQLQTDCIPLIDAVFCEVNPIPVKTALSLMGYAVGACRMPLGSMQENTLARLTQAMKDAGLSVS